MPKTHSHNKVPVEPQPHPEPTFPSSSDPAPTSSTAAAHSTPHPPPLSSLEEVRTALEAKIRLLTAREKKQLDKLDQLEELIVDGGKILGVMQAKDKELARVHKEAEGMRAEMVRLKKELDEGKKKEADSGGRTKMPLTFDSVSLKDALATFRISADASDEEVYEGYEGRHSHPSLADRYHGAFYTIALSRLHDNPNSILGSTMFPMLMNEIRAYLSSVSLSVDFGFASSLDGLPGVLENDKVRVANLDSKLAKAQSELESRTLEMATWRAKAEAMERDKGSSQTDQPAKTLARLMEELARVAEREVALGREGEVAKTVGRDENERRVELMERKLAQAEMKLAEVDQASQSGAQVKEELEELAKRLVAKEEELASLKAQQQRSSSLVPTGPSQVQSKFVVQKLAATVKTLNADLAAKTLENAELMLRFATGDEVE